MHRCNFKANEHVLFLSLKGAIADKTWLDDENSRILFLRWPSGYNVLRKQYHTKILKEICCKDGQMFFFFNFCFNILFFSCMSISAHLDLKKYYIKSMTHFIYFFSTISLHILFLYFLYSSKYMRNKHQVFLILQFNILIKFSWLNRQSILHISEYFGSEIRSTLLIVVLFWKG